MPTPLVGGVVRAFCPGIAHLAGVAAHVGSLTLVYVKGCEVPPQADRTNTPERIINLITSPSLDYARVSDSHHACNIPHATLSVAIASNARAMTDRTATA